MNFDVHVENLSLAYGQETAVKDLNFTLKQGAIYGLIGRNGAGKTTLLSLLASLMKADSGSIRIDGEEPFENARIMTAVSLIYSNDTSDEDYPVSAYFRDIERYRPNFDMGYAKQLTKRFGISLEKPVSKLSSGMQSAVKAILGLASRAPVTLFDEIDLSMDAPTRKLFYDEVLEDQARHPRLIVLSTHLVSEIDYLFDHVLIMDEGHLLVDEAFDVIKNRGVSVTGHASMVDAFVSGKEQLNTRQLGSTKSVLIYGMLSEREQLAAEEMELEIQPASLQDIFIYLTQKEGMSHES